jgi:hypothetical protein
VYLCRSKIVVELLDQQLLEPLDKKLFTAPRFVSSLKRTFRN